MVRDYISIARLDHWFKNVFMLPGTVLAWLAAPHKTFPEALPWFILAVMAANIICSANYTLNEVVDAETDKNHPVKRNRPIPSGRVKIPYALIQYAVLAVVGLFLSWHVGTTFFIVNLALLTMGVVYNVPPVRSKDLPVADVLSESINNPLRFLLGWYAVQVSFIPPVSVLVAYWMLGAFFMAVKRYAEYRFIADKQKSTSYRKSFAYYTEDLLLISIVFYASAFNLFGGIFLILYKMELILAAPFYSGLMAYYLWLGMLPDSPTQYPEQLYKHKLFTAYMVLTVLMTLLCLGIDLPGLYRFFETTVPQGF